MSPDHFDERVITGERPYKPKKRPDSAVQTGQDAQSRAEQGVGTGNGLAVCLRAPRNGKLRVVLAGSVEQRELSVCGWEVADDVYLARECQCGCGLPVPFRVGSLQPSPLQRYADPEACRRALYALQHPTLDLSGMAPVQAKRAARMADEAVRAAKLGQARATVDARSEVTHAIEDKRGPDNRPSCRLRLDMEHWRMLGEIQEYWWRKHDGGEGPEGWHSFSRIVMDLIEWEARDINARKRQEREQQEGEQEQ